MYDFIAKMMKNITMDDKCKRGLSFGVGFQWYNPYVDMGHTGKKIDTDLSKEVAASLPLSYYLETLSSSRREKLVKYLKEGLEK